MIKTIMIGGQISAYSQMTVSGEVFEYLAGIKPTFAYWARCIDSTMVLPIRTGERYR